MSISKVEFMQALLEKTLKTGADAADVAVAVSRSASLTCRKGKLEDSTLSETAAVSLRVFVGRRVSMVGTNEVDSGVIEKLAERAVLTAGLAPDDPYAGLVPADELANDANMDLDQCDVAEFSAEQRLDAALEMEAAALSVHGVRESMGASAGSGHVYQGVCTSNGFIGEHRSTYFTLTCGALAADENGMEQDRDFWAKCHLDELPDPQSIGTKAGEMAAARLGGRAMKSGQAPVVFAPRVANSLLSHLLGAINGAAVAKGTSFLKDAMGEKLFAEGIDVVDDPHMSRMYRSRAFDGEGVATRRTKLIDGGRLTTWLLNHATATQLRMDRTGHGMANGGGPGNGYNVYLAPGTVSPEKLVADTEHGLCVTTLFGGGVNQLTGDYSVGAGGFAIENGRVAGPVKGVTIAGNLKDMFRNLTPADDLEYRYGPDSPTVRVDGMTVAGA